MDRKHAPILKIVILMSLLLLCSSGLILAVSAADDRAAPDAVVIDEAPANPLPANFENPAKPMLTAAVIKEKIAADLSKQMAETKAGDKVKVLIWLNTPGLPLPVRPVPGDASAAAAAESAASAAAFQAGIAAAQKPLTDTLATKGVAVDYASQYAPVVAATLSTDEIKEVQARADVASIDMDHKMSPFLDYAGPAIIAPPAQAVIAGAAKMAIVECDGVAFSNPYLKTTRQLGLYQDAASPNIGAHATACAGIAHSTHPTTKGVAYKGEAAVLSANCPHPHNWFESDLMSATDWAMNNGARVISGSYGWTPDDNGPLMTITKYHDYIVRYNWVTAVLAAGNDGDHAYPQYTVANPAKAFNVIAVGGFKNQATGWIWWDDVMSTYSSWGDPSYPYISGNPAPRAKPEVVASGETTTANFRSTLTAAPWVGWYGGSGTSFAAPAVASEAAVLMNKTTWLSAWPEAVKAAIMASADHNIEGMSRISEYDGVGGVNVNEAYKVAYKASPVLPDKVFGDTIYWNSGNPYYMKKNGVEGVWNLSLVQGSRARFVLVWDSKPSNDYSTDALNADLDLYVERKVGANWVTEPLAGSSISASNNFEIVDFNVPYTGQYRVKVVKFSWLDTNWAEYIGFAAYTK